MPVIPDWSYTSVPKAASVDTWARYDVAPDEAFQESVGDRETLRAPFEGEDRMGAAGTTGGGGPNSEYRSRFAVPAGTPEMTPLVAFDVSAFDTAAGDAPGLADR